MLCRELVPLGQDCSISIPRCCLPKGMTVVSFLVGMSVSGQTFYSFVLENIEKFGALKAIGAKGHELVLMILFQATFTGLAGYGLGVGLCSLVTTVARKLVRRIIRPTSATPTWGWHSSWCS
jgi:ABC-type antimicrobial peptide transport system permease subunit